MADPKKKRKKKESMVEIARSFSFKLNLGNYQSADFFATQKVQCLPEEAEEKAIAVYEFCKKMVVRDVNEYKAEVIAAEKLPVAVAIDTKKSKDVGGHSAELDMGNQEQEYPT